MLNKIPEVGCKKKFDVPQALSNEGIVITNKYGKILTLNLRAEEVLHLKNTRWADKNYNKYFSINNTRVIKMIRFVMKHNVSLVTEQDTYLHIKKNQENIPVRIKYSPYLNEDAKIIGAKLTFYQQDLSLLSEEGLNSNNEFINKEEEAELERYRIFLRNAKDIMLFIDMNGKIIDANKAAIDAYGYSYDELLSINISNIRDDSEYAKQQMEHAHQHGLYFESIHRRKDGATFPVEINTQGAEINGKRILLSVIRDITERKNAEMKLREEKLKYRSLFMNLNCGYAYYQIIYDENQNPIDLKFEEVNDVFESFFGTKKEDIIGRSHGELLPYSIELMLHTITNNEEQLRNGNSITINDYYSQSFQRWINLIIYTPQKNTVVVIIIDISDIKKYETKLITAKEAAESANRAKSEFLANMSHEIRTPINGMLGMLDLTLMTELQEKQKDKLIIAKACANSLLEIINDILDFSKMEAGKITIQKNNFDFHGLMEEILDAHMPSAKKKGIALSCQDLFAVPRYLYGDANRLRQILNNLLNNAIKFTEHGAITISVEHIKMEDEEVELKINIKDTGIGIAPENIKSLFKSFSQIEGPLSKKHGGTGLGLAITKKLVEIMGGTIEVFSNIGEGSTFYFLLKFEIGQPTKEEARINKIIKANTTLNVLIVEDDKINLSVLHEMMKKKGYQTSQATNGYEALALIEMEVFDVILMDIQMPGMDGIETTKRIRELEGKASQTPIVALTAYALQGDREKFLSLGVNEYISKPIDMIKLFQVIEDLTAVNYSSWFDHEKRSKEYNHETTVPAGYMEKNNFYLMLSEVEIDISIIESAKEHADFNTIENMAHEIREIAKKLEAEDFINTAFRIEYAAQQCNMDEVIIHLNKLKMTFAKYLNKIEASSTWHYPSI